MSGALGSCRLFDCSWRGRGSPRWEPLQLRFGHSGTRQRAKAGAAVLLPPLVLCGAAARREPGGKGRRVGSPALEKTGNASERRRAFARTWRTGAAQSAVGGGWSPPGKRRSFCAWRSVAWAWRCKRDFGCAVWGSVRLPACLSWGSRVWSRPGKSRSRPVSEAPRRARPGSRSSWLAKVFGETRLAGGRQAVPENETGGVWKPEGHAAGSKDGSEGRLPWPGASSTGSRGMLPSQDPAARPCPPPAGSRAALVVPLPYTRAHLFPPRLLCLWTGLSTWAVAQAFGVAVRGDLPRSWLGEDRPQWPCQRLWEQAHLALRRLLLERLCLKQSRGWRSSSLPFLSTRLLRDASGEEQITSKKNLFF